MDKNSDNIFRFAPSPTGFLHVGGARTAIFNWLLAQKVNGRFLLRIEDTDKNRSTEEFVGQILTDLAWLGITWDESPVYQSHHLERHQYIAQKLLDDGKAYRCFCSPELLQKERKEAEKEKKAFQYDGRCRRLSKEDIKSYLKAKRPFALRLKVDEGETVFNDLIRGKVSVSHRELDDFVILRSDNTPIYHLAVVTDDHDMQVTHVIRGDDHLSNTPKQILINQALSWQIPVFAHVPLIHGFDGARLSKRHGATSVGELKEKGILAQALFNYLCLLGWAPGDDREIMSRDELVSIFSLERVNKKNAVFDQKKLEWINGKYLSMQESADIIQLLEPTMTRTERDTVDQKRVAFGKLVDLVKIRAQTVHEISSGVRFFFSDPESYEEKGIEKHFKKEKVQSHLELLRNTLNSANPFQADKLEQLIRDLADSINLKAGDLIHPLRLALTGLTTSPGIFEVLEILGKETVIRRLDAALEFVENQT